MSLREIFGTKAFWVFVGLMVIFNIVAAFMLNGGREFGFLGLFDAIAFISHIVAVWLGSQKLEW